MKRPWKDVSTPLRDGMIHWPGDPECKITRVNRMEDGAVCNLTHLSMSAHTGTHMDAPRHFIADGILVASKVNDTGEGAGGRDRCLRSDDTEG